MRQVSILEVGPRDGLQNESSYLETSTKITLIHRLIKAGIQRLEATSFVSPKWIPQMKDAPEVLEQLTPIPINTSIAVLIPNQKGLETALMSGKPSEILVFTAASETFCQKNINCSIEESITRFIPVVERAKQQGIHVRASISCSLGCPYEGKIEPKKVLQVASQLVKIGCTELSIADTIGVGVASQTKTLFRLLQDHLPNTVLGGHFHDTYGQAIANIYASYLEGIRIFDSSVAGLGGCPYAKGATGNVATEDVLYLMQEMGVQTGIDIYQTIETGIWICEQLNRPYTSRAGKALWTKKLSS
jgi:hydroxymethylglutaryl-CoA lyase